MQRALFPILFLLLFSACTNAQKPDSTPPPTPSDANNSKQKTITGTAVTEESYSLKSLPEKAAGFTSKVDGFTIRLRPDSVEYKPSAFPQNGGEPQLGRATWKMKEATIMISIAPIPVGEIASWSLDRHIEEQKATIDEMVSGIEGVRVYEKDITISGLASKETKTDVNGTVILMRVAFANDRQYTILAQLTDDPNSEALAKAALDTFELTKP